MLLRYKQQHGENSTVTYNHLYCVSVLTLTPARTYINIQINDEAPMEAKIKFNVVYSYDIIIETAGGAVKIDLAVK